MKYWTTALLMLFASGIQADIAFPDGCTPVKITGKTIALQTKSPALILIYNQAVSDMWLTHPVTTPGASAGWTSRLQSKRWSALAVSQPSFHLNCIESKPGHEQQVPCAGSVMACQWLGVTSPEKGTYWAGENMLLNALTAHIGSRGFIIPASNEA